MTKKVKIFGLLLFALVFLASCLGSDAQRIKIDGSATVLPLTQAVVEDFMTAEGQTEIAVSASGTGGGFQKFINGETDVQNASRRITEHEMKTAEQNGVTYYELVVANDAIIVAVNKTNTWVKELTQEQLYNIFKADSEIKQWSDIQSDWPQTDINFYVPALDSGTFDYFQTHVMKGMTPVRADVTASQDLNILVRGVEGDANALGFFSYAYYQSAKDKVTQLRIDGVAPNEEAIRERTYPLTRDLYIYVNKEKYATKTVLKKFVTYYMERASQLAEEVGFVPLTLDAYEREKEKIVGN